MNRPLAAAVAGMVGLATISVTTVVASHDCGSLTGYQGAVVNATTVTGLAGAVADEVRALGIGVSRNQGIANAPSIERDTTIYFNGTNNELLAICIRDRLLPGARLAPATIEILNGTSPPLSPGLDVAVFLGTESVAEHRP